MSRVQLQSDHFVNGILPILGASSLFSFGYLIRKILLKDISAYAMVGITSVIAAVFIFLVCRLNVKRLWKRFKAHKYSFIGLSATGMLIAQTLMYVGLDHLDLGVSTLLEKLQPLFTIWLAALFLKEKLSPRLIPYCVLALGASYFISVPEPIEEWKVDVIGIAAVVGAAFFWGIASVIGRSLARADIQAAEIAFLRFAIAAMASTPFLFLSGGEALARFTLHDWILAVLASIGSTSWGYILYYKGLRHVDAPTASFLELVTPIICLFLGIVFLEERLSLTQWAAIPVMLFAVWRITAVPKRLPVVEEAA